MRWTTALLAALLATPVDAAQIMNRYNFDIAFIQSLPMNRKVFECDFTSQTCLRGVATYYNELIVGEILDARDRTTVIGHTGLIRPSTIDYDAGVAMTPNGGSVALEDMPPECLRIARPHNGSDVCKHTGLAAGEAVVNRNFAH